jgi:hypothetical protein
MDEMMLKEIDSMTSAEYRDFYKESQKLSDFPPDSVRMREFDADCHTSEAPKIEHPATA